MTKKTLPNFNVVNGDMIKIALSDYFSSEDGHVEYSTDDQNVASIEGLAHNVSSGNFAGNPLKNCDHLLTVAATPSNMYIGLCNSGKSIFQINIQEDGFDDQGYVKFLEPSVYKKKSDQSEVKFDIPIIDGETDIDCYELQPATANPGYYIVSCKYQSGKLLHFTFKATPSTTEGEGIVFSYPNKTNIKTFAVDDNTEKTKELDQVYTVGVSPDGKLAVAYDTFQNQDLIPESGKKQKIGYWIYGAGLNSGNLEFKDRTFVPFSTLKAQTDNMKMNANFRLSTISWYKSGTSYYAILSGYIPGDQDKGGKIAVYVVQHDYDTTAKYKDFKIIKNTESIDLGADWGTTKQMNVMTTFNFSTLIYTVKATSYNYSQGWFLNQNFEMASNQKDEEYAIRKVKLYLPAANSPYPAPFKMNERSNWSYALRSTGTPRQYSECHLFNSRSGAYYKMGLLSFAEISITAPQEETQKHIYPPRSYFVTFSSTAYKIYASNYDNFLVIDGSKATDKTITVTAKIVGKDTIKAEQKIKISKLSAWNEKVDLSNFKINRVNSYASGWVEIPLGSDSIEGNGVSVEATAEGLDPSNIVPLMSKLTKFKINFTTNKEAYDGFITLNNRDKEKKQMYMAYKYKTGTMTKNKFWFFTCDWNSKTDNTCTQVGKPGMIDESYRFSPYGWTNESRALIYFRSKTKDGLTGFMYDLNSTTGDELSTIGSSKTQLEGGHINNIEVSHNKIQVNMMKKYVSIISTRIVVVNIDKSTLEPLTGSFSTQSQFERSGSNNYVQEAKEQSYEYTWSKLETKIFDNKDIKYRTFIREIDQDTKPGLSAITSQLWYKAKNGVISKVEDPSSMENTVLYQGNKYVTCFLQNDILIVDKSNRKFIFKTTSDRRTSTTTFSFAELQINKVQITECFGGFAQILFQHTDKQQRLMTINGNQALNAKEKIHSIVKLDANNFTSLSLSLNEKNVIYTVLSTGASVPTTTETSIVATYINGPLLKVNLEGFDKNLVVSVKAKAAYQTSSTVDPKKFTIQHIESSLKNTIKINATEDKKPAFKVDQAAEIEDFIEITGAVVDLSISGDNSKYFKLKGRKALHGSFPATSISNSNTALQRFDEYLVSKYNGSQLQFNYMPGTVQITGKAEARFPSVSSGVLGEYTMYQVSKESIRFAIRGTGTKSNEYAVRDTSVTKDGESMQIKFSDDPWIIQRHSNAVTFNMMGTDSKVWVVQQMNNGDKRFNVQIWQKDSTAWSKKAEHEITLDKDPDFTNWITDGDDLWFLYGWQTDYRIWVKKVSITVVDSKTSLVESSYMPFNFFDTNDATRMAIQTISCRIKTSTGTAFNCFIDVAGSQDYIIDYTFNKAAKITENPITELKLARTLNTLNGYELKSFQRSDDLMVMAIQRIEESKAETKTVTDCSWLLAVYTKGTSDDSYTMFTCDDLKIPSYTAAPNYAISGTTTNMIWVSVPRPKSGESVTPINLFTVTPATITPLEFKEEPKPEPKPTRILQAVEKKMADFTKVSIGVQGLDPKAKVEPVTMDKLNPTKKSTGGDGGSGLGIFWWILIIFGVLALVGAVIFFMGQKKDGEGQNYVKSGDQAEGLDDSEIDNAL